MAGIKTLGFAVEDHDPRSWELYRFIADMDYENGDIVSMEFGYKQCSECGADVFDCHTVRYCPICGARVVDE